MIFGYDPNKFREDFPILKKNIIYFDSACMSLKPIQVLNKMNEYYTGYSACAGRSAHKLARKTEEEVMQSRREVRKFISASEDKEIIFTRNTTEGINLAANSLSFNEGDEVLISDKEHNSNLVPWLRLSEKKKIKVRIAKTNEDGTFNHENFENALNEKTRLVSMVFTSNIDGVTNPVREIANKAHKNGSLVLIDAAQAAPSSEIDVAGLDIDLMSFSGHKMLGPTGTGILYGKSRLLEEMEQFITGGETVIDTTHGSYQPEGLPNKFEAGLQDYAGIIGLGEACRYLKKIGLDKISQHEKKLNNIITKGLSNDSIRILGPKEADGRGGIFSFNIKGMDPHDVSRVLDASKTIMTRSGMHCCHSWFNSRKVNGSVRASLYLYNTEDDANSFVEEVKKIIRFA